MKHLKKAAIIGMSVLTAAAVPAVATVMTNKVNNNSTFTMATSTQASEVTTDEILIKDHTATDVVEQKLNNYKAEKERYLTWIIIGSGIMLTMLIASVLTCAKIKKMNELNRSIEATKDAKFFD